MNVRNSISELIGKTPLMRMNNYEKEKGVSAAILAKLEFFNPAGSAKDRVGREMLDSAEKSGLLCPESVIIEPTSGNTGIGIAAVAASRGYRVIITMPETMSVERQKLIAAYGAEVVLTDGAKGMSGAIEKAKELAEKFPKAFINMNTETPIDIRESIIAISVKCITTAPIKTTIQPSTSSSICRLTAR